jgi:hypothetical protein
VPDYGPTPRVKRVSLTPRVKREKSGQRVTSLEVLENAIMGKLIYTAGNIAGKQAARIAWNYGLRDKEKLKYVKNFAQNEARSDTFRLLQLMRMSEEGLPAVTIIAEEPKEVKREEMLNMKLRQLREASI